VLNTYLKIFIKFFSISAKTKQLFQIFLCLNHSLLVIFFTWTIFHLISSIFLKSHIFNTPYLITNFLYFWGALNPDKS